MKDILTKKNVKRFIAFLAVLTIAVVLTGCANNTGNVSHTSGSWWDRYVIYYFSQFLLWLADLLGKNYGWTIIVFTILVRLLLFPLNAISIKSTTKQQQLQPEIDKLRAKYPGNDAESRQLLNAETQKLYKEAGINPYLGCFPMLLQLPFMFALYQAIYSTKQLQDGTFLWMNLSKADPYYVMPILAAVFTFMSSYVAQMSAPESSSQSMTKAMMWITPLIVAVPAISFPTAITLYWGVSSIFSVVQTFILQNPFKYAREQEAKKQAEKERQRKIRRAYKKLNRKK